MGVTGSGAGAGASAAPPPLGQMVTSEPTSGLGTNSSSKSKTSRKEQDVKRARMNVPPNARTSGSASGSASGAQARAQAGAQAGGTGGSATGSASGSASGSARDVIDLTGEPGEQLGHFGDLTGADGGALQRERGGALNASRWHTPCRAAAACD